MDWDIGLAPDPSVRFFAKLFRWKLEPEARQRWLDALRKAGRP